MDMSALSLGPRLIRRRLATLARRTALRIALIALLLSSSVGQAETAAISTEEFCAAGLPCAEFSSALSGTAWNGVVVFDGEPVRFSLEINRRRFASDAVFLGRASRRVELPAVTRAGSHVTLTIASVTGERLEGEVAGDSLVGYYHPPAVADATHRTYPFRATRDPLDEISARPAADFGGEWIFTLRSAGGQTRTATALIGQGSEKLHAIWRESDGTRRYLAGRFCSDRFTLEELCRGPGLILGRSNPVTGVISGEFVDPSGRVAFTARRSLNLAGLD